MFGHTPEQATLPMGIEVTMDADIGAVNITEQCVV